MVSSNVLRFGPPASPYGLAWRAGCLFSIKDGRGLPVNRFETSMRSLRYAIGYEPPRGLACKSFVQRSYLRNTMLSTFLCKIMIRQFLKEWFHKGDITHIPSRVTCDVIANRYPQVYTRGTPKALV